jgi:hypothetical protein
MPPKSNSTIPPAAEGEQASWRRRRIETDGPAFRSWRAPYRHSYRPRALCRQENTRRNEPPCTRCAWPQTLAPDTCILCNPYFHPPAIRRTCDRNKMRPRFKKSRKSLSRCDVNQGENVPGRNLRKKSVDSPLFRPVRSWKDCLQRPGSPAGTNVVSCLEWEDHCLNCIF